MSSRQSKRKLIDTTTNVPSKPSKKIKRTSSLDLSGVKLVDCVQMISNDALKDFLVPDGLLEELEEIRSQHEIKKSKSKRSLEAPPEALLMKEDDECWIVQLCFAKHFIFTVKILKEVIEDDASFVAPCSYKGYPLKVDGGRVEFPIFSVVEGSAAWSFAEFDNNEFNEYPSFSVNLSENGKDETLVIIDVRLDNLYKALGKPANGILL